MSLTRRTHVLLDDERHARLRQRSQASGRSMGDLIREAIDRMLADEAKSEWAARTAREQALQRFLAAEPMPVDDWPEIEREIERSYERSLPGK